MQSKELLMKKIINLRRLFEAGKIPKLHKHEVNPGLEKTSRENYLYFTLPPCLNFQRNSPAMWQAALKTWNDPETNYLFFPEKTHKNPREKIQRDLLKHKLSLQKNKHTDIWIKISTTFHTYFKDSPKEVITKGKNDASKILKLLQEEMRESFPYLRGPKMANYWLYILSQYTDIKLKNMNAISIIPDTHVIQCSIKLGVVKENDAAPEKVAEAWRTLLGGSKLDPVSMHPVLWNWSRNNFLPKL